RLADSFNTIKEATVKKERSAVRNWPAYLLTLLKKVDSDQAWKAAAGCAGAVLRPRQAAAGRGRPRQDREARARARVVAAAASNGATPEAEGGGEEPDSGNW
ncbi:unnamed protein product, partial [Prorocentrum cordatum]